ncbi:uncharacterized protein LOC141852615 [Brevipalpus obovatus]|uniref:uncharacterized protein LOC141852615 n=1 Tax=Brevipalpus obovatus TaxID=246614 RepID=UPI003D9F6C4E
MMFPSEVKYPASMIYSYPDVGFYGIPQRSEHHAGLSYRVGNLSLNSATSTPAGYQGVSPMLQNSSIPNYSDFKLYDQSGTHSLVIRDTDCVQKEQNGFKSESTTWNSPNLRTSSSPNISAVIPTDSSRFEHPAYSRSMSEVNLAYCQTCPTSGATFYHQSQAEASGKH